MAVACGGRDSFDACVASLAASGLYDVTALSAEMGMQEIEAVASAFRRERPWGDTQNTRAQDAAARGRAPGPAEDAGRTQGAPTAPTAAPGPGPGTASAAADPARPAARTPMVATDETEAPGATATDDGGVPAAPAPPAAPRRRRRSPSPPAPPPLPRVLVTTDPPLRALSKETAPRGASLLVHYDMPLRPEALGRRIKSLLRKPGAGRGAGKPGPPGAGGGAGAGRPAALAAAAPPPSPASVAFVSTIDGDELAQYVAWTDILPAPMPVHASDVLTGG